MMHSDSPMPASARHVLFCATLILLLSMGVRATFGLFMPTMGVEQGWGRDVFSMAFAIQNLVWGATAVLVGALADRWGAARTLVFSILSYAAGLIGMRYAQSPAELYLYAGVLVGMGQAGTTFAVLLPAVARAVPVHYRGTAMGIASAGGSMGQFIVVPIGQLLIDGLDWSGALWVLSSAMMTLLPLVWWMRGKPRSHAGPAQSMGGAVKQAVSDRSFHFLLGSYFVCGFHTAFVTLHLPAYAVDRGLSPTHGAMALAIIGLFNVLGCYGAGHLGGIYSKKKLLAGVYFTRSVAICLLLLFPLTPMLLYVFSAVIGLAWLGTVPLTTGLIGQIYGMRYAATLSGLVFFGHQWGSFIGVWGGGKVFVELGSYDVIWWISLFLGLAAAALALPIRERALVTP
ncbi:MAG: MFS transporter [Pigmentiphaga sp.]